MALCALVLGYVPAHGANFAAPTNVCGGLFEDTTWAAAASPYNVTCNVTLFPGYTLTIEPGVTVQFQDGTSLIIRGTLQAIGTASNRIAFTSANPPNTWGGVQLATNLGGKGIIAFTDFSYASTALSVECCWGVPDPANISDSTFRNNGTALGGYAGNNVIVRNSTFENNGTAITNADKLIYDSVFRNNTYGLYATERISVYNSIFEGNQVALYGGRGTVQGCTIQGNGTGVKGFFEGFILSRNTISSNSIGVILTEYGGFSPSVEFNNIFANALYDAKVEGPANKSAPNNWWGTTNTAEIDAKIYDGRDNPVLGLLEYLPILTGPVIVPPVPDIKANGSDGPLTIAPGSNLTVTVALNPGAQAGANADWWVAAQSPFGLYWYTLGGWVRSDAPIRVHGGPLFALAPYTVLNTTGLPVGAYTFYFGVDMLMNGSLDFGQLHVDSVGVTIQ